MGKYILKRLLWMIPVVFGVAIVIFTIMEFVPGDVAKMILGSSATAEELAALNEELGLNNPFHIRLLEYLKDVFLHFDLGTSYFTKVPVTEELLTRFPRTLLIALCCMLFSIVIGVPLGINAAVHQDSLTDRISMFIALFGVSIPSFWLALMLVVVFALNLRLLPATGFKGFKYLILPVIANSFGTLAGLARQSRSAMLEVIRSDYVTTARAKGLSENAVIWRHALPNALIPIITSIGSQLGGLLGGTLVIESVFSIPGIGLYMINAVNNRDFPVVRGSVIFLAIVFSIIMLLTDLAYSYVDPTIKAQYVGNGRKKEKQDRKEAAKA